MIMPQPALSLCSADHEKFMEEFRCQIRAYALNADTDQPFCGDKGSTVNTSRPLSVTLPIYRHSIVVFEIEKQMHGSGEMNKTGMTLDGWRQRKPVSMYSVILGNMKARKDLMVKTFIRILKPFFTGNLQIDQLQEMIE